MSVTRTAAVHDAPPPGSKARRTHDALLDALARVLADGGYAAATSTAVAEEAGVSIGTFYGYFGDRDHALAALFARRLADLLEAVTAELTSDALLDHGLRAVVERAVATTLREYRDHAAVLRAALGQLPASPAIRDAYWSAHEATEAAVATFIRRGQSAGKVRDGDPDLLARTLLVVVQGANHPLLLRDPRSRATRALEAELADLLHHLLAPRR